MCGRFTLTLDGEALKGFLSEYFAVDHVPPNLSSPRYNIAPGQDILTIIHDGSAFRVGTLRWGYKPTWAKTPSQMLINARGETVDNKPTFKRAFQSRRCVFMADGFYEWQKKNGARIPHHFYLQDKKPFLLAGVYQKSSDVPSGFAGVILTTQANGVVAPVHHRMPVMFTAHEAIDWLRAEPSVAKNHLKPFPDASLAAIAVGDRVNRADADDPSCLTPR